MTTTDNWTRFREVARHLRRGIVDFPLNGDSECRPDEGWSERLVRETETIDEANAISSQWTNGFRGQHALLLDLDVDHVYVPSSTPYHGHLIVNVKLEQEEMQEILNLLGKYGILQGGFVEAARFRKSAWPRAPWSKKRSGE